jgi:hypothetical protein
MKLTSVTVDLVLLTSHLHLLLIVLIAFQVPLVKFFFSSGAVNFHNV